MRARSRVSQVVVGNYRCSLAGLDLNRMWREPSRKVTPPIYAMKAMLRRLQVCAPRKSKSVRSQ